MVGSITRTSASSLMNVSARVAKRRANSWLVSYVGNLLMADEGTLVQVGQE